MKFKVGDIITGLDKKRYGYTTDDGIMKITHIYDENKIQVLM